MMASVWFLCPVWHSVVLVLCSVTLGLLFGGMIIILMSTATSTVCLLTITGRLMVVRSLL